MKTPDEIKKALECCFHDSEQCADCPYYPVSCDRELVRDAREYIRQLEADKQQLEGMLTHMNQLRDAAAGRALTMEERVHQLEAERDAAVKELKRIGKCVCCKHDKLCTFIFPNCVECEKTDCPCHTCEYRSNWEWRGVPKEE